MKIDRRDLHDALLVLAKVADPKSSLPILGDVLLEVNDEKATLRTTDLNSHLIMSLPVSGDLDADLVTAMVDVKKLEATVKPDANAGMELAEIDLVLEGDKLVAVVDDMRVKLPVRKTDVDFPAPPPTTKWKSHTTWATADLGARMDYVLPAVCTDMTRPHIATLAFVGDRIVGTDGHRLHTMPTPGNGKPTKFKNPILITRKAAEQLRCVLKCGDHATVLEHKEHVRFVVDGFEFTTKKFDGKYPEVDQVICKQQSVATVDAEMLAKMLKKLDSICKAVAVKMVVNGAIELSVEAGDDSAAVKAEVLMSYSHEESMTAVNPAYLADALKKSGAVELTIGAPMDPIRIDGDDGRLAIVMPCRQ